jgi:DNA invertase Pin-like site-specific DNA recombinase
MPILDTRENGQHGLVGKFISDLVLQILSFVAQNERENIKERQAEGIRLAKARGVQFGRPKKRLSPFSDDALRRFVDHELTCLEAAKLIGVSKTTFFRLVSERNGDVTAIQKKKPRSFPKNL